MAVIPSNVPQTVPAGATTVQSAQVKAAQAAFFHAALNDVQATSARPQTASAAQPTEPDSQRLPRLGQLLDIRI